jgi:hypothetical protein
MAFSEENEDVLQRMRTNGKDLSQARDINFSVVFPDENTANRFAYQLATESCSVDVRKSGCVEELPWDVTVTRQMVPRNEDIAEFEAFLEDIATSYSGRNDGWGCF